MLFPLVIFGIIGLSGLIALWLSITFTAFKIYRSGSNIDSSITLARIAKKLQHILLAWFIVLGIVFLNTDTGSLYPLLAYILFIAGFTYLIFRMYGNILSPISKISKFDGNKASAQLINNSFAKIQIENRAKRAVKDFKNFKNFFWASNGIISGGVLIGFWINDTEGVYIGEVILASVAMVLLLQVFFLPIYFIAKKIILLTLSSK